MNLIERRRGMVNTAESLPNYVSDGLVLWLDGILKDNNDTTKWVDLVEGHVFVPTNENFVYNNDNVELNQGEFTNESFTVPSASNGTIEVVVTTAGTGNSNTLFAGRFMDNSDRDKLAFGFYYNYIVARTVGGNVMPKYNVLNNNKNGSFSITNTNAYQNGNALTTNGGDYWSGTRVANVLAGKTQTKIYCLRNYNKKLTQQEVMHNLAIDNERFNLGLTL